MSTSSTVHFTIKSTNYTTVYHNFYDMVHILTSFTECFPTSRFRQSPPQKKTKPSSRFVDRIEANEWQIALGLFFGASSKLKPDIMILDLQSPEIWRGHPKSQALMWLLSSTPLRFKLKQPVRYPSAIMYLCSTSGFWGCFFFCLETWVWMVTWIWSPNMIFTYLYRLISDIPNFGSTFDYFERHLCYCLVLLSAFVRNDVTFTWAVTKNLMEFAVRDCITQLYSDYNRPGRRIFI